jgi:integrase/recombinase XerD
LSPNTLSPIEHLRKIEDRKVKVNRKHHRRPLSVAEVRQLLDAARKAPDRYGMTGLERALLYQLAVETGLRASELRSLTRSSFQLEGDEPTVTVAGAYTKSNEAAVIPLRIETATALRESLRGKVPAVKAFSVPPSTMTAAMLRADLEDAGISCCVDGKFADFHALRHTCGTWLAAAGTHPKVIQRVMRHSTITLTMDRYTRLFKGDEAAAVASLPTSVHQS